MFRLATLVLILVVLVFSCSPQVKFPPSSVTVPSASQSASVKESWQQQWEKSLNEAGKQGKVVIYTTLGSDTTSILRQGFKDKYGIEAEFIGGGGGEIAKKLLTERRAGIYLADIFQGGANTAITSFKPEKALDAMEKALILPEVTDARMWVDGKIEFVDKDRTIFPYLNYTVPPLAINTDIVKPEDIKSYKDLLASKWKGKMTLQDPTISGTGINWFGVVSELILNMDFMRNLAKQEPVIIRDRRLQVEWLAQGKYPLAIAPQGDTVGNFIREGAHLVKLTPIEGAHMTSGSGNVTLINQAVHPDAARVYLNWLLGREAQTLHSMANLLPSARVDVPTEGIDPTSVVQPGVKYYRSTTEDFILRDPQRSKAAQEVFGQLMK